MSSFFDQLKAATSLATPDAAKAFHNVPGWDLSSRLSLAKNFIANSGGRAPNEWVAIAVGLTNRPDDVATFARIAGWTAVSLAALANQFSSNAGGRSAAQWAALAAPLPNRENDVAAIARIANWNAANLATLAGLFAANAANRTAAQWAAIAAPLPNRENDVAAIARIANWNAANLATLAGLFAANAANRTVAQWAAIAAQLVNRENDVAAIARIANWNAVNLATLAGLFAANAANRTAAQWAAIAAHLVDRENDVATIARIPQWNAPDLATLAQNLANYGTLKPLVLARSGNEKNAALASQPLLTLLKNSLPWNDFAKVVELLGRQIPNYGALTGNNAITNQLQLAWQASNPSNINNNGQHEEGGWVFLDLITGALSVQRQAAGGQASINLSNPPNQADSVVVAKFHTHPNLGPNWVHGPSGADINVDALHGVPDIVVAQPGWPGNLALQYFLSGPASRAHLAGNQGLPGALGGIAP